MSGPKISEAELRKRRLDKLIGEENIRIQELNRQIRKLNCVICDLTRQKDMAIAKYNGFISSLDESKVARLENIQLSFEAEYTNLISSINYNDADGVNRAIEQVVNADCIKRFWNNIIETKDILDRNDSIAEKVYIPDNLDFSFKTKNTDSEISLVKFIDKIENSYSIDEQLWAEQLITQIDILLSGNEFINDDKDTLSKYKLLLSVIVSGEQNKGVSTVELVDIASFVKKIAKYVDIYHTYVSNAMELGSKINPISSFYSTQEIEAEKNAIEKIMSEKLSQDYIEKSINEVMKKHGYNVDSGSKIKGQNNPQKDNIIDRIYQNADKHIRVFSSASGHTVMEVVGDCSSESEIKKRYDEQVAFCKLYPEIVEELERDYDIIINTKKNMEPQSSCKEIVSENTGSNEIHKKRDIEEEKAMR